MSRDTKAIPPVTFTEAFAAEQDAIPRGEGDSGAERELAGLAFSGGGIRSATFNLGVIQALAELGLLRHFDYLSTVSGGGYIGSWLSSFIHRRADGDVRKAEALLHTGGQEDGALRFLRSYSNYLTPRTGLFSADTLTAVATYLRNLYLNLSVLLLYLAAALLLPRILVWSARWLAGWEGEAATAAGRSDYLFGLGGALIVLAMLFIGLNLSWRGARHTDTPPFYTRQSWILLLVVFPTLLAAWFMGYGLYVDARAFAAMTLLNWVLMGGAVYFLPWILGWVIGHSRDSVNSGTFTPGIIVRGILFAAIAAALGGLLLAIFVRFAVWVHPMFGYSGSWIISALGAALMLKFFSLTVAAHIGLMGRDFSHETREWWSRLGGWMLLCGLIWAAVFSIVFLAPAFFKWAPNWFLNSGGLGWLGATAAGVLLGRSPAMSLATPTKTWRDHIAVVTPYMFVVGLLGLMAWGLQELLLRFFCVDCAHVLYADDAKFFDVLLTEASFFRAVPIDTLLWLAASGLIAATLLALRVDVNLFSIYHFYRLRLTRCYLGATRNDKRSPHPFTGFDPHDDLALNAFCRIENGEAICQRPYPILNTAMNLVHGKQLAWQERRAAAFAFTPLYSGYDFLLPDETGARVSCYRPSATYMDGVMLGSALAISGAAAAPNMGYHSSPALTFLMTVFNVRLGHWSGNPAHPSSWHQPSPKAGGNCLLKELFGLTDEESPYVYLSDGGHFENLGVYELIRRECAQIVVIDAAADAKNAFDDLGNMIRKVYADFGVVIDIRVDELLRSEAGQIKGYFAVGNIQYDKGKQGTLIYLKPGLTGHEPADSLNYARTHATFPHQSTADQCFDESQFESYRKLGHWIGKSIFGSAMGNTLERRKEANDTSPLLPFLFSLMREEAETRAAKLAASG